MAELVSGLLVGLGKGPGYVGLGIVEVACGAWLAYASRDLVGFAAVLGAVNAGVFGGGAWKASAEARNGSGAGVK